MEEKKERKEERKKNENSRFIHGRPTNPARFIREKRKRRVETSHRSFGKVLALDRSNFLNGPR